MTLIPATPALLASWVGPGVVLDTQGGRWRYCVNGETMRAIDGAGVSWPLSVEGGEVFVGRPGVRLHLDLSDLAAAPAGRVPA